MPQPTDKNHSAIRIIVPGAMCTDITVNGVRHLPQEGEDAYGTGQRIGPGAKSRNIADMAARLAPKGSVAMLSRTAQDPYGLWRVPYDALQASGVNLDFVKIVGIEAGELPAIALVMVDDAGNRQAAISNSVIDGFSNEHIDWARPAFDAAANNGGLLALSLELPLPTAIYAMQVAEKMGIRTLLDPGGLSETDNAETLLQQPIYLLKPNEHEVRQLSGVDVTDMDSAEHAAGVLRRKGVKNVLITHGGQGAYLFGEDGTAEHLKIPDIEPAEGADATGCGDQVLAALSVYISEGTPLTDAARLAVAAGTLQFNRAGIQPVSREDLAPFTEK